MVRILVGLRSSGGRYSSGILPIAASDHADLALPTRASASPLAMAPLRLGGLSRRPRAPPSSRTRPASPRSGPPAPCGRGGRRPRPGSRRSRRPGHRAAAARSASSECCRRSPGTARTACLWVSSRTRSSPSTVTSNGRRRGRLGCPRRPAEGTGLAGGVLLGDHHPEGSLGARAVADVLLLDLRIEGFTEALPHGAPSLFCYPSTTNRGRDPMSSSLLSGLPLVGFPRMLWEIGFGLPTIWACAFGESAVLPAPVTGSKSFVSA